MLFMLKMSATGEKVFKLNNRTGKARQMDINNEQSNR